jgi:hypothetical protein
MKILSDGSYTLTLKPVVGPETQAFPIIGWELFVSKEGGKPFFSVSGKSYSEVLYLFGEWFRLQASIARKEGM